MPSSAAATATQPADTSRYPVPNFGTRGKRSTVLCLLLVLLTLAFYNSIVHNSFTNFDDNSYITDNSHVQKGLTWATVRWAFTSFDAANWHPLTWVSHALDYQLFKLNPVGPHYVSVLLHATNAILLFLLLEWATGFTWCSFMVAALFALHPMNVESVAWAAERKNVLSMLFFLLTLHAYTWYVRRQSIGRYLAVAAMFALGLMAKPEVITLPFVLLLWDYWPLRRMGNIPANSQFPVFIRSSEQNTVGIPSVPEPRSFWYLLKEKLPLLALSAGSAVVTIVAQRAGYAVRGASNRVRFGNALIAYVRYVGKAFWPSRLAVVYPHLGRLLSNWQIIASAVLLIVLTATILWFGRSRRYLVVGWFWFLGTLVPVIGVVQVGVQAMADRYAYIPYIGLFICVVWGAAAIAREKKIPPAWLIAASTAILVSLGITTYRQIGYWRDSETLWRHTLSVTDSNFLAHDALGRELTRQGRIDEAIAEHKAAESLHAYTSVAMIDVGVMEQSHGHLKEAIQEYGHALDTADNSKDRSIALSWLGSAFAATDDLVRARKSYGYALRENPENTAALVGSGLLAEREGDLSLATDRISQALKIEPNDVAYLLLAQAFQRAGNDTAANDAVAKAKQISPDFGQAQQMAAHALLSAGIKSEPNHPGDGTLTIKN